MHDLYIVSGGDLRQVSRHSTPTERTMCLLKGTSGTGKGTRVMQLMSYLTLHHPSCRVLLKTGGAYLEIGTYIKDMDILFMGKSVVSNKSGLESWSSLDYINSKMMKTERTQELILSCYKYFSNIVAEGEPLLCSYRYRVEHMHRYFGVGKFMIRYYKYDDIDQYHDRILQRSGRLPNGTGGWDRNKVYEPQYKLDIKESQSLPVDVQASIVMRPHTEPHIVFGAQYLEFIGASDDECMYYTSHCQYYDARRAVPVKQAPYQLQLK